MKKLGSNQKQALAFAKVCNAWHTFAKERSTTDAIKRLEKRGLVETNGFNQFKITEAGKLLAYTSV